MFNYRKIFIKKWLNKFVIWLVKKKLTIYQKANWEITVEKFKQLGTHSTVQYPFDIKNAEYICIGDNFKSGRNLRLEAITKYNDQEFEPSIIIGNNVSIQTNCHIGAINKIVIRDNVMIASNVFIADSFHGKIDSTDLDIPPARRCLSSKGIVWIGNNVWIGDGVSILAGVEIGDNVIVGANSVVTKSFPANVVIAGNPARIIKYLK